MSAHQPDLKRTDEDVEVALLHMVDEGLLQLGVNELGEAVFWPTKLGVETLGMMPVSECELDVNVDQ